MATPTSNPKNASKTASKIAPRIASKIAKKEIGRKKTVQKTTGLRYWMLRALEECEHVSTDFSADPVHDLRVSLRRCRSMADGLIAIDPDPDWKAMKKAGKRLFQRLGALRDIQIMMEWIEKLFPEQASVTPSVSVAGQDHVARALLPATRTAEKTYESRENAAASEENPDETEFSTGSQTEFPTEQNSPSAHTSAAHALLAILARREAEQKREARAALEEFDRKQWRQWSRSLPQRAAHIRPGSAVFKHLALERWTVARELHTRALRNRSKVALHTLRIGIKRFRYIVEKFLPLEHKAWSKDLKDVQDLLGEVHDLDVLWTTALASQIFPNAESREAWHRRIAEERAKRVESYRKKMVGPDSRWNMWRAGLPQDKQIQALATQRMKLWAKALDPDFAHSEHVARLALELYDGLAAGRLLGLSNRPVDGPTNGSGARASLLMAALLHDVGKSQGNKGHHKASMELIKAHSTPLGWSSADMRQAATVARFHCGALPTPGHKALRDLLPDEQKTTIQLAAILRLANAFDAPHDRHIRRVQFEGGQNEVRSSRTHGLLRKPAASLTKNEALVIAAEGYVADSPTAQTIAAERHLLETVLRRPVVVRAM